ncbi:AraC family transcriptional regulator [Marinobacter halophilus]|uniref:AraC family transcriptional regulator n=1 Tax=Marinobacter halophilus TaxID=1323740 RepID=A0A2T1K975_9GAMM|nr:AraC family transcriptional regulator [Marinobacter halophilus]PSF06684.1 AraC family transcriptional regulator [Marinobacter halophilus]GGC74676.1 AraC family transcriptional regulator [Marinobacter halophilus]
MSNSDTLLHPVTISQVMINFAARQGVDRQTCLLGTGIAEEDMQAADGLITRAQEMRLIENLILALPDLPALGFRIGLQYNVATFGIWGFALRTSRTLRDATALALRYLPLSTAYCKMHTFVEGDGFGVAFDAHDVPRHLRQFLLERDLATGLNLFKELSLAGFDVQAIELKGEPLVYASCLEELSGVGLTFHKPRNALVIRRADADRPLPTFDPYLVQVLDHQCRQQLERRQSGGFAGQVRQQLLGPLGLVASLDEVARTLAVSPRSLRRKLDQEGTSFRKLLEEERSQLALQLLKNSSMKLDELAIHLGYTDTASFTRAFRRWMNCSPGEYRKATPRTPD